MHFQGTRNDNERDVRQQFLKFGEEVQTELAFVQHVIEHEHIGFNRGDLFEGITASFDADQIVLREGIFVDLVLEIVVLDNHYRGGVHGKKSEVRRPNVERSAKAERRNRNIDLFGEQFRREGWWTVGARIPLTPTLSP